MKTNDIKNILVITKKWRDRLNGNTYFAQEITVNFGLKNEETFFSPMKYGYDSFQYFAVASVEEKYGIKNLVEWVDFRKRCKIKSIVIDCAKEELLKMK